MPVFSLLVVMLGFLLVSLVLFCLQARKEGINSPPFHFAVFILCVIFLLGVMGLLALLKTTLNWQSLSLWWLPVILIGVTVAFAGSFLGARALLRLVCLKGGG